MLKESPGGRKATPRRPPGGYWAALRAKLALAAFKDDETLGELANQFGRHANAITR